MSKKAQTTIERLRLAIHGVTSPFSCHGTLVPRSPVTLVFKDQSKCEVNRAKSPREQANELKPLLEHCRPAPFGEGKKTRHDRTVRDALQLKAEKGGFTVENFEPGSAGILKKVQRELLPHDPNPISAELYAVNVYTNGGHFAPHKDTPRGSDMFGTLVVCLPSQFSAGQFVLRHRGVVQKFDWGRAIEQQKKPHQLQWVAFFGDVDHQIERVWGGARVTLSYLLRRGAGGPPRDAADEDLSPRIQEAWQALLADESFLPGGGILAYPCCHLYHQDARFQQEPTPINEQSAVTLKGRDHLVAITALEAGLKVAFNPYMFENCADETWQLNRFPTRQEQARLGSQMDSTDLENTLPIRASSEQKGNFGVTWLESPPSSDETTWRSDKGDDSELPAAAHLHSCEYCPWGYFGNEGSEIDLYTYAALHITIPPSGKGLRVADKRLKRTPVKRPRSTPKRRASSDQQYGPAVFNPDQYALLDFGERRKLERFGMYVLDRPSPAADNARKREPPLWQTADARFERRNVEAGVWHQQRGLPDRWPVAHGELTFEIRLTPFGHVGLFPEQAVNWDCLQTQLRAADRPLRLLNLFAHTGGCTLAAAAAGAAVTHVDASKGGVAWARHNAALSGLADAPIRWIVEDALKFVRRELRRGNRYDGVILDPPSYGHGPSGEAWKLDEQLPELIDHCLQLTGGQPRLAIVSCHSPGWPADRLAALVEGALPADLELMTSDGRRLPAGCMATVGSSVVQPAAGKVRLP